MKCRTSVPDLQKGSLRSSLWIGSLSPVSDACATRCGRSAYEDAPQQFWSKGQAHRRRPGLAHSAHAAFHTELVGAPVLGQAGACSRAAASSGFRPGAYGNAIGQGARQNATSEALSPEWGAGCMAL